MRIDDTDTERSKAEYEEVIESSLVWMGMDWDEKTRQKDRFGRYEEVVEKLKESGHLYPCYETPEELSLKRKTQLSRGLPPIYDRAALNLTAEQVAKYEKEGRQPHWRFKLVHEPIEWDDLVRGPVKFQGDTMSDPVVLREDGRPLYHLCSVIDDFDYAMTHIVRGEDHVSNTAAHIQMFKALGAKLPAFAHLPLINDIEGGKLSKRLGAMSVRDLRKEEGLEPMALVSLLARLGSADPIEPFTDIQKIVESFDITKFSKGAPKFDFDELLRLNAKILHEADFDIVKVRLANIGLPEVTEDFWLAVRSNIVRLEDVREWWNVARGPIEPAVGDGEFLAAAADLLPEEPWDENTWKQWTESVRQATGRKGKDLFMPLRKALTGMDHGPELASLLPLIGRARATERLA